MVFNYPNIEIVPKSNNITIILITYCISRIEGENLSTLILRLSWCFAHPQNTLFTVDDLLRTIATRTTLSHTHTQILLNSNSAYEGNIILVTILLALIENKRGRRFACCCSYSFSLDPGELGAKLLSDMTMAIMEWSTEQQRNHDGNE